MGLTFTCSVVLALRQVRISLILTLLKIRQHLLVTPAFITLRHPMIIVPLIPPDVQHRIQHTRTPKDLSSGPTAPLLDHGLARGVLRLSSANNQHNSVQRVA